jgi:hypothetical protein
MKENVSVSRRRQANGIGLAISGVWPGYSSCLSYGGDGKAGMPITDVVRGGPAVNSRWTDPKDRGNRRVRLRLAPADLAVSR